MKKKIDDSSPLYPHWVCAECGKEAMEKAGTEGLLFSTFHKGRCGVCGKEKSVTELRDFGYPPVEIDFDNMKARDEAEDKRMSPSARVDDLFIGEDVRSDLSDHSLVAHKAMVFCDIDGLLADAGHRLPYLENKEYDKFYGANMADDGIPGLAAAATIAFLAGIGMVYKSVRIRFLTGRPERTRTLTAMWLRQNYPTLFEEYVPFEDNAILCREDDDFRPAHAVKLDNVVQYFEINTKSVSMGDISDLDFVRGDFDTYILDDDPNVISVFDNRFTDTMAKNFGCDYMYCHTVLMSPKRISSYAPSKSDAK